MPTILNVGQNTLFKIQGKGELTLGLWDGGLFCGCSRILKHENMTLRATEGKNSSCCSCAPARAGTGSGWVSTLSSPALRTCFYHLRFLASLETSPRPVSPPLLGPAPLPCSTAGPGILALLCSSLLFQQRFLTLARGRWSQEEQKIDTEFQATASCLKRTKVNQ